MDEFKYQLGQFGVSFSELMLDLKKWIDWVTLGTNEEEEAEQKIKQEMRIRFYIHRNAK